MQIWDNCALPVSVYNEFPHFTNSGVCCPHNPCNIVSKDIKKYRKTYKTWSKSAETVKCSLATDLLSILDSACPLGCIQGSLS